LWLFRLCFIFVWLPLFSFLLWHPSSSLLFPYTTLFRSLFAAGEVAGFGGGGIHGYRSLEGTFLGNCLFTGRVAGQAIIDCLKTRSEEHTSELQSRENLVCRLLLEKKKK